MRSNRKIPNSSPSSPNALFVSLEHVQKLEADTHPLPGVDTLGATICDTTNEIDGVLLHLFVSVAEDRRQAWKEILDGRLHLGDTNNSDNRPESSENRSKNLGILLAQVLVEDLSELSHQSILPALLHNPGDT